jgi:GR25 family glycosyltransferase involved in LPS biosynthesis
MIPAYVITILDNPKSKRVATRCIESAAEFGIKCLPWKATTPDNNLHQLFDEDNLMPEGFIEEYSRLENCMAAFHSHFSLWKHCVDTNQEIIIFEHDAVVVNAIPEFINYQGCLSLGKPSYGRFNNPFKLGVNPLTSKRYFPGAHAYCIKPGFAQRMIAEAKRCARPTDVFLHLDIFPNLEEYYPWPVEAWDSFTTIQKEVGCLAKHNYGNKYEII